jgi:hypothetical protein
LATLVLTIGAAVAVLGAAAGCAKANAGDGIASANGTHPKASNSPSAAPGDRVEQLRAFAQCMRDHGVDVPDPEQGRIFVPRGGTGGGGGGGGAPGFNPSDPTFQAAMTACRDKLPNGGEPPKLNAEQIEQFRQFAQCMRDHGVNVPDPNADGTLQFGPGRGLGQIDRNDPNVQAAFTACRDKLGDFRAGIRGGGPGGPGGTT